MLGFRIREEALRPISFLRALCLEVSIAHAATIGRARRFDVARDHDARHGGTANATIEAFRQILRID